MESFIMSVLEKYDKCVFEPYKGKPFNIPGLCPGDEVILLEDEHYDWENGILCMFTDREDDTIVERCIPLCCLRRIEKAQERNDRYHVRRYIGLDYFRIFKDNLPMDIYFSFDTDEVSYPTYDMTMAVKDITRNAQPSELSPRDWVISEAKCLCHRLNNNKPFNACKNERT